MYDAAYQELLDGQASSQGEWDRADARQRGEENPEAAWVLTDRDVWHPNPFYTGPAVPHPEDYCPEEEEVLSPEEVQKMIAEHQAKLREEEAEQARLAEENGYLPF